MHKIGRSKKEMPITGKMTGETKCIICTSMVADSDMAGDICLDCLNDTEREKRQERDRAMREACAVCRRCEPNQVDPVPQCLPRKDGSYCPEIDRILSRKEAE